MTLPNYLFSYNKMHGDGNQNIFEDFPFKVWGPLGPNKTHQGGHTYFLWSLVFSKMKRLN